MSAKVNDADPVLSKISDAMQGCDWRIEAVMTFTHGVAVQVWQNVGAGRAKWVKVGPYIIPSEEQTVADLLKMLGDLAVTS